MLFYILRSEGYVNAKQLKQIENIIAKRNMHKFGANV
jgi:hypothetical protein